MGRIRGHAFIASAVLLAVFVFPQAASAHGRSAVIALDYQARPATAALPSGVEARVVDGDRSLELAVAPGRVVVVRGYGQEPFLRFSARGVEANLRSPTAVAARLVPETAARDASAGSSPRWRLVAERHRLTWHDHRLGPRAGDGSRIGRVGSWTIPLVVDGEPQALEGGLWRSARPLPWPWLAVVVLALATAGAVGRSASAAVRRRSVYVATAASAILLLVVSVGFAAGAARVGLARWADLVLPALIALAAGALLVLRPRQRYVACALVAGFVLAAVLEDLSVFWHGFVVSSLPTQLVRSGVAVALGASLFAIVVVVADLLREKPGSRRAPRAQPRLAVPKGKQR